MDNYAQYQRRDNMRSFGLVLVFIGMQINTIIRNIIPSFDYVEIIMLFSVLLLIDIGGLKTLCIKKKAFFLLSYQVILLLIAMFSSGSTTQLISFHLYLIAYIVVISTHNVMYEYKNFTKYLFYVSGIGTLVVCFQATDGFSHFIWSFENTAKLWLDEGGDPVTLARMLTINVIAILMYKKEYRFEKIVAVVLVVMDIIGLFSFSNRAALLCAFFVTIIWFFKKFSGRLNLNNIIKIVIVIVIVAIVVFNIDYFREKIVSSYLSILNGVGTLLGMNMGDSSASSRVTVLRSLQEAFWSDNAVLNMITGLGYNYTYVDRPVYQAFFDLGIFNLLAYVCATMVAPLRNLFRFLKTKNSMERYSNVAITVIFISIQTIMDQFYCGLPYYYYLWTPAIFLICANFPLYSSDLEDKAEIEECLETNWRQE